MDVEVGVRGACKCSTRWAGVSMAWIRSNRGPSKMGIGRVIVDEGFRKMIGDGRRERGWYLRVGAAVARDWSRRKKSKQRYCAVAAQPG